MSDQCVQTTQAKSWNVGLLTRKLSPAGARTALPPDVRRWLMPRRQGCLGFVGCALVAFSNNSRAKARTTGIAREIIKQESAGRGHRRTSGGKAVPTLVSDT